MAVRLNPYLSFPGTGRQAMEFYQSVLGGHLVINTFGEFGRTPTDGLLHGRLDTALGFTIMAADLPEDVEPRPGANFSISISGEGQADALRGYFAALSEGGRVRIPMKRQLWGDEFGSVTDKFGINWMINIGGGGTLKQVGPD